MASFIPSGLGTYVGYGADPSCAKANINLEIVLLEGGHCTLDCTPEMSWFEGGSPAWFCEGTYDENAMSLRVVVEKEDFLGPREGEEVLLLRGDTKGLPTLMYNNFPCTCSDPVPLSRSLLHRWTEKRRLQTELESHQAQWEDAKERLRVIEDEEASIRQEKLNRMNRQLNIHIEHMVKLKECAARAKGACIERSMASPRKSWPAPMEGEDDQSTSSEPDYRGPDDIYDIDWAAVNVREKISMYEKGSFPTQYEKVPSQCAEALEQKLSKRLERIDSGEVAEIKKVDLPALSPAEPTAMMLKMEARRNKCKEVYSPTMMITLQCK